MADRNVTGKAGQDIFGKDVHYQAHMFVQEYGAAVRGGDACGFLAAMLQSMET